MSRKLFISGAVLGALLATGAVQAATVYCPNGATGALVAPTSGRYVQVTNAANPGACYYTDGNLDTSSSGAPVYENAGYTLLSKTTSTGSTNSLLTGFVNGSTSGTWTLAADIWNTYSDLHIGFHFGNGGGNPDSFIVELEKDQYSGNWQFFAIDPAILNGLSNIYLFTKDGGDGGGGDGGLPEPNTLALLGLGLLGLGFGARRKLK